MYVYVHYTPGNLPFYVGKGSGMRSHERAGRSALHQAICDTFGGFEYVAIKKFEVPTEEHQLLLERSLIRILLDLGFPLVNETQGGDGGKLGRRHTEAAKQKIKEGLSKTMSTDTFKLKRAAASRKMHTPELRHIKSLLAAHQWSDPAVRAKMREKLAGYVWITDGPTEKRLPKNAPLPEGWFRGRRYL